MKTTDQFLAYLLLRLTIGLNFIVHAVSRFFSGTGAFRDKLVADFAQTPIPAPVVYMYGTALSYVELAIGLLLTIGLFTRYTLVAAMLLMISLMVGTSFQQKWDVVSTQLTYSFILFVLVWAQQANLYSVDRTMLGRE